MKALRFFFIVFFLTLTAATSVHAQLVNIESRRMQTDTLRFAGNVNITLNHRRTNDITLSVFKSSLNTQFKSKNLKHTCLVLGNYAFTRSNTATLANVAFGHLRYNYKYKDWLRWEAYTQLQLNELLSLKYRFLSGAGARFKLTRGDVFKAYIGVSAFYEHELVEDELQTEEARDIRISNYFSFSIRFPKKRGEFASTTYYQPLMNFWADYRITTQSLIQLNITKHLSFITSVNYFFDYNPPVNVKPSTFSINNGLRVRF
jgi:hypothetical protein